MYQVNKISLVQLSWYQTKYISWPKKKNLTRNKVSHFIIITHSNLQEYNSNLYAPNSIALEHIEQKQTEPKEILTNIPSHTSLSIIIDQENKNINKDREYLNSSINKQKVIHGIWHPMIEENTFFVSTHGTFLSIDQMLTHKMCLKDWCQTTNSDHNVFKSGINQ